MQDKPEQKMKKNLKKKLKYFLRSQNLAVLASYGHKTPYCSLMTFADTPKLDKIILATPNSGIKFNNLLSHPNVSLLVDNRKNQPDDAKEAWAVTVLGRAEKINQSEEIKENQEIFLLKNPHLTPFIQEAKTALFKIIVLKYILVQNFQEASVLEL